MAGTATVDVTITTDATKAEQGFNDAAIAADKLGTAVDQAGAKADAGASRIDSAAAAADGMESKAAKATGALGALSSGFELVGLPQFADGLNQAAMATDFVSGSMDSFTLLTELNSVAILKNKAATMAQTVASKAQAAATKAMAVAQRVLNASMIASPIGAVIALVLLLVAGFVLLYKKSDTFRALVDRIWAGIKTGTDKALGVLRTFARAVGDLFEGIGKAIGGAFDAGIAGVKAAINAVIRLMNSVIRGLNQVPGVSIPTIPEVSAAAVPGATGATVTGFASPSIATATTTTAARAPVIVNVNGALDPDAVARQLQRILGGHNRRVGLAS
jgi:phage-related protein